MQTKLALHLNRLRSAVLSYHQAAKERRPTRTEMVEVIRASALLTDYAEGEVSPRVVSIQRLVDQFCAMPVRSDRMDELQSQADLLIGKIDLLTDDLLTV